MLQRKGAGLSNVFSEANDACIDILTGDAWPYFKEEYLTKLDKGASPKVAAKGT